jgi:hypothetical protein
MRNADSCRRIINPYTRAVWIANPDNVAARFFRICNQKDLNISICNAKKYHINTDCK